MKKITFLILSFLLIANIALANGKSATSFVNKLVEFFAKIKIYVHMCMYKLSRKVV